MVKQEKPLHNLVTLEQFKSVLGVDDREDKLAGYCLVASTYTIEQYCKRRLLRKKYFERITPPCAPKVLPEKEHFGGFFCHGVSLGLKKDGSFGDVRAPLAIKIACWKMTLSGKNDT
jgi:hypothetical protein